MIFHSPAACQSLLFRLIRDYLHNMKKIPRVNFFITVVLFPPFFGFSPWSELAVVVTFFPKNLILCPSRYLVLFTRRQDISKGRVPSLHITKLPPPANSAMARFAGGGTLVPEEIVLCPFRDHA